MASGLSRRMGEDKLKLEFRNKLLFQHIVDILEEIPLKEKIIVSSKEYILDYGKRKGFKTVYNKNPEEGQSTSIVNGLQAASDTSGYIFFVADQPFIKKKTILRLIECFVENPDKIIIPFYDHKKGSPVIFPLRVKKDLLQITGDQGGSVVIKKESSNCLKVDFKDRLEGIDIDDIETYEKYKEN